MARATLEMFLKLTGADKTSRGLDKVSKSTKDFNDSVEKGSKQNAKFASGMSGLSKAAIAGGAIFATKAIIDFSRSALEAAVSAEEAGAAFDTTFGTAAVRASAFLEDFANKAGLTVSEAKQLQATLGAVAQGIGFTQEQSADLSIELTKVAADVASFSNVSSGAAPVLRAFQSAILGENEALKSYGLAISASEVETKALEITLKRSTSELTRQDRALATLALIQDKAAVQIGDLDRTAGSFANQSRALNAELRQLREEIGEELIPVAAELLPIFREFAFDVAPILIEGFGGLARTVGDLVLANERLEGLGFFDRYRIISQGKSIKDLANEYRNLQDRSDLTAENLIEASIAQGLLNRQQEIARQNSLKQQVQYKKVSDTIDKFLNPIFGEQNALLLTNIQLETARNRLLKLTSSANDNVEKAEKERAKALKNVEELQIAENLADAQAAIRKSELKTEIALLTRAEESGKDVTNELALARAELAEAEFELVNDSDRLIAARNILEVAENNLSIALDNQKKAIDIRNDALLESIDLINKTAEANKKLIDQGALLTQFRQLETAPITTAPATTEVPSLPVQDFSTRFVAGKQQTSTVDVNLNLTDAIGEIIQRENIKIQERGNTFVLEG
jgi:hypothetical protein